MSRVRVLRWQGDATVFDGERRIEIGVDTQVVPFRWARSRSWLRDQGPSQARTMLITPEGGWIGRAGRNDAAPGGLVTHERAQFAVYGLMLLEPLLHPGVTISPAPGRNGLTAFAVRHPDAPPATLYFDGDGRLAELEDVVPDPGGGAPIAQRFLFSREVMPGPVRWPRRLEIFQKDRPYFELTLNRFEAAAA
ncbi:MAG TPA: hypothetical protein VF655_00795 [Allosphingosinicella sp.]